MIEGSKANIDWEHIFSQDDARIAYLNALQCIGFQDMHSDEEQQNREGRGTTRRPHIFRAYIILPLTHHHISYVRLEGPPFWPRRVS